MSVLIGVSELGGRTRQWEENRTEGLGARPT
jgi:hypothetical protein